MYINVISRMFKEGTIILLKEHEVIMRYLRSMKKINIILDAIGLIYLRNKGIV